jgi:hypothetical protein
VRSILNTGGHNETETISFNLTAPAIVQLGQDRYLTRRSGIHGLMEKDVKHFNVCAG